MNQIKYNQAERIAYKMVICAADIRNTKTGASVLDQVVTWNSVFRVCGWNPQK